MELLQIKTFEGRTAVSARDLYEWLNPGDHFAQWAKRMFEYGFTDNIDYKAVHEFVPAGNGFGGTNRVDYILTMDCAKEISMIQRTEKGKQARQYFIECERKLSVTAHKLPVTYADALRQLAEEVESKEKMQKQLEAQKPAVEFFNAVTSSKDALPVGDVAKVLDMGIGQNKLFALLRTEKILNKDNTPYQQYIDSGYFRVIIQKYLDKNGETHTSKKTLVYQKGMAFIKKVLEKNLSKV